MSALRAEISQIIPNHTNLKSQTVPNHTNLKSQISKLNKRTSFVGNMRFFYYICAQSIYLQSIEDEKDSIDNGCGGTDVWHNKRTKRQHNTQT